MSDYKVLSAVSKYADAAVDELEGKVENHKKDGYKLVGGVTASTCVEDGETKTLLTQAVSRD